VTDNSFFMLIQDNLISEVDIVSPVRTRIGEIITLKTTPHRVSLDGSTSDLFFINI